MRITGGRYVGRTVQCPPGVIRPTMDRMRESVFAILGDLTNCSFLDLFSGSGIVALEAASRGAEPVHLVERDRGKRAVINSNIAADPAIVCHFVPVERYVQRGKSSFDYVFLDPPFAYQHKHDLLRRLAASPLVAPGSLVIMHVPSRETMQQQVTPIRASASVRSSESAETAEPTAVPPAAEHPLVLVDQRTYGGSHVVIYNTTEP